MNSFHKEGICQSHDIRVLYKNISLKKNNLKQTCLWGRDTSFSTERCRTVVHFSALKADSWHGVVYCVYDTLSDNGSRIFLIGVIRFLFLTEKTRRFHKIGKKFSAAKGWFITWGRLLSENGSRIKLGQDFFRVPIWCKKRIMSYVFVSHAKIKNIFTKREVLLGLNAHAEEDLAEATLIAVQIAWINERLKWFSLPLCCHWAVHLKLKFGITF